jgi:16S rRNA (uracil1498-N3)-methyltransferase
MTKIRLLVNEKELHENHAVDVSGSDFQYLTKVMRVKVNDRIILFNGLDGDFISTIIDIQKKKLSCRIENKLSNLKKPTNITLAFSLIKSSKIDFIAQKASEMGVARFQPIITQYSSSDKMNEIRFNANVKEACEQCERNDLPTLLPLLKLANIFNQANKNKIFICCDESGKGLKASILLTKIEKKPECEIVVLIGPEGGFSEYEFSFMRDKNVNFMSLGPRILRAETAVVAAITLIQEFVGDFE